MKEFFKNNIQPLVNNLDSLIGKEIKVIHLTDMNVSEYNQDFGGREELSTGFNNFLDLRKI